jgi:hypothetical protein
MDPFILLTRDLNNIRRHVNQLGHWKSTQTISEVILPEFACDSGNVLVGAPELERKSTREHPLS